MRLSEFWRLMDDEFGAHYSRVLAKDVVLGACGDITVVEALERGVPVRQVWEAICDMQEVPESRRLGRDIPPRKN
ncbi:DUF3046 domain-containing protein [Rothia sp. CCM 9418]|uniref:DUF3046 domain-containing protein n=1 Tax=Rothia sp. CCM 9418 TaxID=3402661 RepID=UPI003AEDC16A